MAVKRNAQSPFQVGEKEKSIVDQYWIVLKKSRLDGDRGAGGAITLHMDEDDAIEEAHNRALSCEGETYFVCELREVGQAKVEVKDVEDRFPHYKVTGGIY